MMKGILFGAVWMILCLVLGIAQGKIYLKDCSAQEVDRAIQLASSSPSSTHLGWISSQRIKQNSDEFWNNVVETMDKHQNFHESFLQYSKQLESHDFNFTKQQQGDVENIIDSISQENQLLNQTNPSIFNESSALHVLREFRQYPQFCKYFQLLSLDSTSSTISSAKHPIRRLIKSSQQLSLGVVITGLRFVLTMGAYSMASAEFLKGLRQKDQFTPTLVKKIINHKVFTTFINFFELFGGHNKFKKMVHGMYFTLMFIDSVGGFKGIKEFIGYIGEIPLIKYLTEKFKETWVHRKIWIPIQQAWNKTVELMLPIIKPKALNETSTEAPSKRKSSRFIHFDDSSDDFSYSKYKKKRAKKQSIKPKDQMPTTEEPKKKPSHEIEVNSEDLEYEAQGLGWKVTKAALPTTKSSSITSNDVFNKNEVEPETSNYESNGIGWKTSESPTQETP